MLKYLFTVVYKDGSVYEQNAEDKSIKEPEKRSCFYDIDHDRISKFSLKGDGHEYSVDLTDGHFEVDGVSFFMHENSEFADFKLIFFRQHTHSFLVGKEKSEEMSHEIVYRMGWQCEYNGRNYQEVMQIS